MDSISLYSMSIATEGGNQMTKLIVALVCTTVIFCSMNANIHATIPSGPDILKQAVEVDEEKGKKK